ncbi:MAG: hypothetical protein ACMG6E_05780 [Candidatus Roizmanbacteria bacterium]
MMKAQMPVYQNIAPSGNPFTNPPLIQQQIFNPFLAKQQIEVMQNDLQEKQRLIEMRLNNMNIDPSKPNKKSSKKEKKIKRAQ